MAAAKKEGGSMSFAKDIGEKIQQSVAVNQSTGNKTFGGGSGNPNLIKNSPIAWVVVVAAALLLALYLYLRMR